MIRFGWCADGHHKDCRIEFPSWNKPSEMIRCECECHAKRLSTGDSKGKAENKDSAGARPTTAGRGEPETTSGKSNPTD